MLLSKQIIFLCSVFVVSHLLMGCDMIAPKAKKPVKAVTPVAATIPAPIAPTADKKETQEALPENVIAKVGSWTLTKEDFINRLTMIVETMKDFDPKNEESKAAVLEELVRQQVLVFEAKKMKLNESKEIISAMKDLENTLLVQELVGRLTKDINVSEDEAKQFYQTNSQLFTTPEQKKLREIVVSSQAEAKDILVSVLQGTDFSQIATERSKSKTAANGGDLGWLTQAPFDAMLKAAIGLNKGEVSAVFEGPEGFYIVKVEDVKGGELTPFNEVKDELIRLMTMQKQQEIVMKKIQEVAEQIQVQVNADLLKN